MTGMVNGCLERMLEFLSDRATHQHALAMEVGGSILS